MNNLDFVLDYNLPFMILKEDSEYREFDETIEFLEYTYDINDVFYIDEAVKGNKPGRGANRVIKNVKKNFSNAGNGGAIKAYDKVTDAGGSVVSALWNLFWNIIKGIGKIVIWIAKKFAAIINAIATLGETVKKLSTRVKNSKINNMSIYITPEDIKKFYDDNIFSDINTYIANASNAVKNGGLSLKSLLKGDGIQRLFSNSGIKSLKHLNEMFNNFSRLDFEESTINLKDEKNIATYFSCVTTISFTDLKHNHFHGNYYQALHRLLTDLRGGVNKMSIFTKMLDEKYDKSIMNTKFGRLSKGQQQLFQTTVYNMGKTMSIIGKIIKYCIHDIKSIRQVVDLVTKSDPSEKDAKNKSKLANADIIQKNVEDSNGMYDQKSISSVTSGATKNKTDKKTGADVLGKPEQNKEDMSLANQYLSKEDHKQIQEELKKQREQNKN